MTPASVFTPVPVDVDRVRRLRHDNLRAGRPRRDSEYEQDAFPDTVHFGVLVDDVVIGCLTLFPETFHDEPAWRLRGMATDPRWRGQGVGRSVVVAAQQHVRTREGRVIWCNARTSALGFYQKEGFEVVGPEFLAEGVPHQVGVWRVSSGN